MLLGELYPNASFTGSVIFVNLFFFAIS